MTSFVTFLPRFHRTLRWSVVFTMRLTGIFIGVTGGPTVPNSNPRSVRNPNRPTIHPRHSSYDYLPI